MPPSTNDPAAEALEELAEAVRQQQEAGGRLQLDVALPCFTGSKAHNAHLRRTAQRRGRKLSEHGLERVVDGTALEVSAWPLERLERFLAKRDQG